MGRKRRNTKRTSGDEYEGHYRFVAKGVAGLEKWGVGGAKGLGQSACYRAVMAYSQCSKDYFSYAVGGDENCGCKTYGTLRIRMANSEYYKIVDSSSQRRRRRRRRRDHAMMQLSESSEEKANEGEEV